MTFARQLANAARQNAQAARQAFRAVLERLDATRSIPPAQFTGLAGETIAGEFIQHYGIASSPPEGAEVIVVPVGGASSHCVVIASIHGMHRIALKQGEVALHTDEGDVVHFKRGRIVELVTETLHVKASREVIMETPKLRCTGDIADKTRSMDGDRQIYNLHDHLIPSGGKTDKPGIEQ